MDTVDTVTIRAELINELSAGVASVRGELASLQATVKKLDETGAAAAAGGLSKVGKNMDDLTKMGKSLGSGIDSLVGKLGSDLVSAAERGATALGAITVAAVGWGVKTTMSFQQSQLAINTFLGSATAGIPVFNQLKSLIGPVGIGDLTQGFQSLATAGANPQTDVALLKSIADISAVQVDPGGTFTGLSQAINRIQETGMIESRALLAFMSNGVDAYGLLSQEMGVPRDDVKKMLASGGNIAAPAGFLTDFANESGVLSKFQGGLGKQRQTLGGELQQVKTSAAQVLAAGVQPLTDWLGKETPKVTKWMDDVKTRFAQFGPSLGQAWKSGNMSGVGADLSSILFGDQSHAGDFESLGKGVKGLVDIFKNDLIPVGKDILGVAIPALKGLDDILSFLGNHKGIVEGLIITFGGFLTISKVSMVLTDLAGGFATIRGAIGDGGFLLSALNFMRGMLGLEAIGGTAATAGGLGSGAAGASGAAGMGFLGPAAAIGGGGYLAYSGAKGTGFGSDLKLIGGSALIGAGIGSIVPGVGTAVGAAGGALVGGTIDLLKHLTSNQQPTSTTVIVHPGAINVTGVSDPVAAANAVPKALQDQIDAYNRTAAERAQTQP